MNFSVENMSIEHIGEIAELEKECFSSPWSENSLKEELNNPGSHFLVAVNNGVLGYIGVQEICGEAYITNIAVFEKLRGNGTGRSLLKAAVDGAKSRNCEFITLEVRKSNTAAIKLYESEGFIKVGSRKNFYSEPPEDALLYTKYFTER